MLARILLSALSLSVVLLLTAGCQGRPTVGGGIGAISRAATSGSVDVPKMPATVEEFTAWRNQVATEPEGGAAVYVVALATYAKDKDLGLQFLTIAIDQAHLVNGNQGVKGRQPKGIAVQRWKENIGRKPYVARSYFEGTSPENSYQLPAANLEISYSEVRDLGGNRSKVFVVSSGADSPRPITLQQNDKGLWKAWEWSSLSVGTRPPKQAPVDDDL